MNAQPIRPLVEVLAEIPDFRHAKGKRHPLPTVLTVILLGLICQQNSIRQIATWAASLETPLKHRLRFRHGHAPSNGTLQDVLRGIDLDRLTATLAAWLQAVVESYYPEADRRVWALDGKTLRHSADGTPDAEALQMLNVVVHHLGSLVTSRAIPAGVGETTQARAVLEDLVIEGHLITADAAHTKRPTAAVLSKKGGICSCA